MSEWRMETRCTPYKKKEEKTEEKKRTPDEDEYSKSYSFTIN